jgi:hypothetical protein
MDASTLREFQTLTNGLSRLERMKQQIEKDFGLAGFLFSEDISSWEALLDELAQAIKILRGRNDGTWMKVVFRVDFTEKQYRFVKELGGDSDENLAKAVILREFQKIITREQYGQKSKE